MVSFIYLSLGNTPHNPVRFANTVGIVIERQRPEEVMGKIQKQGGESDPDGGL